jgi:hypothetical protein
MSNVFTLESLNDELETKYGPFKFQAGKQEFTLPPLLRLPETERDLAINLLKHADESDEDLKSVQTLLEDLLRVVVRDGKGDALLDVLNHDLLSMQIIIEKWTAKTQPGEA